MIMEKNKEVKSSYLKRLEKKLIGIEKSENYLMEEISKIRQKKAKLKEKIKKEKRAISLMNRAKKIRASEKER